MSKKTVLRVRRLIRQKSTNLDIHRTESWLVAGPANLSQQLGTGARFLESALERVRHALKPATSQVVDLVIALFLFFPEGEIFLEELNDGLGISEGLFIDIIDLLKCVGEGLFTKLASLLVVVHDLVMEDREVESKTKSNWIASVQSLRCLLRSKIGLIGTILNSIKLISFGTLSNISIVVTNHLLEESFGFIGGAFSNAGTFHNFNNGHALSVELLFDLSFVSTKTFIELRVLWILLNSTDSPDGGSFRSNLIQSCGKNF